jgi:adenylate cyclase
MKSKILFIGPFAIVVYLLVELLFLVPQFQSLEWKWFDTLVQLHQSGETSESVIAIGIDEGLFEEQGLNWPLDKNIYGELIDYLDQVGAKAILFDIMFTHQTDTSYESDMIFRELLKEVPSTVLTFGGIIDSSYQGKKQIISPLQQSPLKRIKKQVFETTPQYYRVREVILPYNTLIQANSQMASNNLPTMVDGKHRNIPLGVFDSDNFYPGLALSAWMKTQKKNDFSIHKMEAIHSKGTWALSSRHEFLPSYRHHVERLPLSILRNEMVDFYQKGASKFDSKFQGKVVIIGPSAASLGDLGLNPLSYQEPHLKSPNMMVHAYGIDALLNNEVVNYKSSRLQIIVGLLLLSLIFIWGKGALHLILYSMVYFIPAIFSYNEFPALNFYPIFQWYIVLSIILLGVLIFEWYQKKQSSIFLIQTFGTYLSPDVIQEMEQLQVKPKLGGERIFGSILFTDIESFSSFSEELEPEQLIEYLNEYFQVMTTILLEEGATVDKFIGDAIVAFFGAPKPLVEHSYRALRAAQRMQEELGVLRQIWTDRVGVSDKIRNMQMRIGVHCGDFVVGNIGCDLRMNYTMIGDSVNLTARLESIASQYGVYTNVSLDIVQEYERIKEADLLNENSVEFQFRELDKIQVKGREAPVQIMELLCHPVVHQDLKATFETALNLYYRGDFDSALKLFRECDRIEVEGSKPSASKLFIQRCEHFVAKPPADWDGIYRWESK